MYSLLFIIINNIKKKKGDILTLAVLGILASFMLYTGASVLSGISKVMDTAFDNYNGAHIYYQVPSEYADDVQSIILENQNISEYDRSEADVAFIDYKISDSTEWSNFEFILGSFEEQRTINTLDCDTSALSDNDILIPYYLKSSFPVGCTWQFRIGDNEYSYNVAGYIEDAIFASSINITVYNVYMSDAALQTINNDNPNAIAPGCSLKIRFNDPGTIKENRDEIWNRYNEWAGSDPARLSMPILEVNWPDMKGGGSFMPQIVMAVIMLFAVLILFIAVIVINFSIRNFIEKNMKNTGILEASGYTTKQLILASMLENSITAVIASTIGVTLAILGKDAIGDVISIVMGLSWNQPSNIIIGVLTIISITLIIALTSLLTSLKYKKITVLECLRGGVTNHNFKKNHLPFTKTNLPLPLQLSLKDILGDKGRNIILVVITIILAVSTNVGFTLLENFAYDTDATLTVAGIEAGTVTIKDSRDIIDEVRALDSVDKVIMYYTLAPDVSFGDNTINLDVDVYDDLNLLEHDMIVEGRLPEADNEIMLTQIIGDELGVSLGDIVYLEYGDTRLDYVVTGFDQKINHLGRKGSLTDEGAQRLAGAIDTVALYVYAAEGEDYESLSRDLAPITSSTVEDTGKQIQETISTVSNSMKIICIVIVAVTILVVIFVEMLLIRSKMIRENKNYGINKALGFTSGQLMLQIMIMNIPTITLGVILGTILSLPASNYLINASFILFGMRGINYTLHPKWMAVTLIGIIVTAMVTSLICSLSVRKTEPVELLMEE